MTVDNFLIFGIVIAVVIFALDAWRSRLMQRGFVAILVAILRSYRKLAGKVRAFGAI